MVKGKEPAVEKLLKLCEETAYDRKAENILRINLKDFSAASEYFILCTAMSSPHVQAIADRIERVVREKLEIKPNHTDGSGDSGWIIVDYGNVMVHVMTDDIRDMYQLESLWGDAPKSDAVKRIETALKRRENAAKKKAGSK